MMHLGRGPTLEDAAAAAATLDRHQFASGWGLVAESGTELRFCVIDDGWALAEVRENAHHAAFTMVSVVAVEEPLARIVGIELDGHGFHEPDYDGVLPGPVGSDLEGMAVDVQGCHIMVSLINVTSTRSPALRSKAFSNGVATSKW